MQGQNSAPAGNGQGRGVYIIDRGGMGEVSVSPLFRAGGKNGEDPSRLKGVREGGGQAGSREIVQVAEAASAVAIRRGPVRTTESLRKKVSPIKEFAPLFMLRRDYPRHTGNGKSANGDTRGSEALSALIGGTLNGGQRGRVSL